MNPREAKRVLDSMVRDVIVPMGFRRVENLRYARVLARATGFLAWPCRNDRGGFAAFSCIVGVRLEKVTPLLSDEPSDTSTSSFGIPLHLLREDKSQYERRFSDGDELQKYRSEIVRDLNQLALPFIDRHSDLSNVRRAVESPDPGSWVPMGLNKDSRLLLLAAIQFVEGDTSLALKTIDDALIDRPTIRQGRFEFDRLRKRIDARDTKVSIGSGGPT